MAIISDIMDALEEVVWFMNDVCSSVGLSISSTYSKILVIHPSTSLNAPPKPVHLNLNKKPVEAVKVSQYFGSIISQDCTLDREINSITSKATCALGSIYTVLWCRRKVRLSLKCAFSIV